VAALRNSLLNSLKKGKIVVHSGYRIFGRKKNHAKIIATQELPILVRSEFTISNPFQNGNTLILLSS
jgi:hypothetical protein